MKDPCPICRGSRKINLPVHKPMAVASEPTGWISPAVQETSKSFPCPECSPHTSEDRVDVLQAGCSIESHYLDEPGAIESVKENIASQMAYEFVKKGVIRYVVDQPVGAARAYVRTRVTGTLGVVAPRVVASMQKRIKANDFDVIRKTAEAAVQEIHDWNSYKSSDATYITRGSAYDAVWRAMKKMQASLGVGAPR